MPTRHLLLLLALLPLLACSLFSPEAPVDTTRPADFSARYDWSEGSLPPPYHYEYIIHLDPSGAGLVEMVPDYPGDGVPIWTETFTVEPAALDAFYSQLVLAGAFSTQWREVDDAPVGGSHYAVTLTANGQTTEIPRFVVADQAAAQSTISEEFVALVPQAIWDKFDSQREAYIRDNSN
jgi:hypothetical protein